MRSTQSLRRVLLLAGVVLLIVLLTGSAALAAKPDSPGHGHSRGRRTPTPTSGPKVVCLDPGHGGSDPGAVYGGLQEKDLNLQIAELLSTDLSNSGYSVVMTRTGDVSLTNTERANICNAGNANAVIAIHLNASSNPNIDYFQAFWGKRNKDLAFARTITDNYSLPSADGSGSLPINPVGQFASGVLLKSNAPATLAETVFLSNPDEQALLKQGTRQQQIADALYTGLTAWLGIP